MLWCGFSPSGERVAFAQKGDRLSLWVGDCVTGTASHIEQIDLNGALCPPSRWVDEESLLCLCPTRSGAEVDRAGGLRRPEARDHDGAATPVRTFRHLLNSSDDDQRFEAYFRSQLKLVDSRAVRGRSIGPPAIFTKVEASPSGQYVLIERVERPFSRVVPLRGFRTIIEVWDIRGTTMNLVGVRGSLETVSPVGVPTGPRDCHWLPTQPATLVWVEALDGGDPRRSCRIRDGLFKLQAPFHVEADAVFGSAYRISEVVWTEDELGLITEVDRATRRRRTWLLQNQSSDLLWEEHTEDAYGHRGVPVSQRVAPLAAGRSFNRGPVVLRFGDSVYFAGAGAKSDGGRPFLDRLNLKTRTREEVWNGRPRSNEVILGLLTHDASVLMLRSETPRTPPNIYLADAQGRCRRALTTVRHPLSRVCRGKRHAVSFCRTDGVPLSAVVDLPRGHHPGHPPPLLLWVYSEEFTTPAHAGQARHSKYAFPDYVGVSPFHLVAAGYGVVSGLRIPIVGEGETANDSYIEQLVDAAHATVGTLIDLGLADAKRIAVGGHSYGAFTAANLLAHTRLFAAGIAMSGAYNRTLTPFGFQRETRTFWEVPDVYARVSPFWYADQIRAPILLIHGESDANPGTHPCQSERFYSALAGLGLRVRYVALPYEGHGIVGRENVLHVLAEMINWLGEHLPSKT